MLATARSIKAFVPEASGTLFDMLAASIARQSRPV